MYEIIKIHVGDISGGEKNKKNRGRDLSVRYRGFSNFKKKLIPDIPPICYHMGYPIFALRLVF
jgi:hypothetical protein